MNILRHKKQLLLITVMILGFFAIGIAAFADYSASSLTVGDGSGMVQSNLDVTILIYVDNLGNPVSGASVTIKITVTNGDSGQISDGIITPVDANGTNTFSATNDSGYIELIWNVPTVVTDISSTIDVSVDVGYNFSPQNIVITPKVTHLDVVNLATDSNVYIGEATALVLSMQSIAGGEYDDINVLYNSSGNLGTFTPATTTTTSDSLITHWTAPDSIGSSTNVILQATLTLHNGAIYKAYANLTVHPYDLQASTILPDATSIVSGSTANVTITSQGQYGLVGSVDVQIAAIPSAGSFNVTSTTTNTNGVAIISWTAPIVNTKLNYTLEATLNKSSAIITINTAITVSPILYTVDVVRNATTVDVNDTVVIDVSVSHNSSPVANANVHISASDGFFSNSAAEVQTTVDANGTISFSWVADFVPLANVGSDVSFTIEVYDNNSGVTTTTMQVHVNPLPVVFGYAIGSNKAQYYFDETITLTTLVLNSTQQGYAGAVVTYTALTGTFVGSNSTTENQITNATGYASVNWVGTGLSDVSSPTTLTFDVHISIATYEESYDGQISVQIIPKSSTSTGGSTNTTPSGGFNSGTAGIVAGALIGVVAVVVIIVKKKV